MELDFLLMIKKVNFRSSQQRNPVIVETGYRFVEELLEKQEVADQ